MSGAVFAVCKLAKNAGIDPRCCFVCFAFSKASWKIFCSSVKTTGLESELATAPKMFEGVGLDIGRRCYEDKRATTTTCVGGECSYMVAQY